MAIILKNAPKTEEGRKLNLSKEEEYGADISVLQQQQAYFARRVEEYGADISGLQKQPAYYARLVA